jgi:hypothetical protein
MKKVEIKFKCGMEGTGKIEGHVRHAMGMGMYPGAGNRSEWRI